MRRSRSLSCSSRIRWYLSARSGGPSRRLTCRPGVAVPLRPELRRQPPGEPGTLRRGPPAPAGVWPCVPLPLLLREPSHRPLSPPMPPLRCAADRSSGRCPPGASGLGHGVRLCVAASARRCRRSWNACVESFEVGRREPRPRSSDPLPASRRIAPTSRSRSRAHRARCCRRLRRSRRGLASASPRFAAVPPSMTCRSARVGLPLTESRVCARAAFGDAASESNPLSTGTRTRSGCAGAVIESTFGGRHGSEHCKGAHHVRIVEGFCNLLGADGNRRLVVRGHHHRAQLRTRSSWSVRDERSDDQTSLIASNRNDIPVTAPVSDGLPDRLNQVVLSQPRSDQQPSVVLTGVGDDPDRKVTDQRMLPVVEHQRWRSDGQRLLEAPRATVSVNWRPRSWIVVGELKTAAYPSIDSPSATSPAERVEVSSKPYSRMNSGQSLIRNSNARGQGVSEL